MEETNPQKKNNSHTSLNFFTITRKFWKDQVVFYIITTLSAVSNYVMDINLAKTVENIVKGNSNRQFALNFWNKTLYTFQNKTSFFWFWAIYIFFYCLIVIIHVYYAFYLNNKISRFLKRRISQKLFQLDTYNKEQVLTNLDGDEKAFTRNVIHYPNQIYYLLLTVFLIFAGLWGNLKEKIIGPNILIYGFIGFVLIAVFCLVLNFFVYQKDLLLQEHTEKVKKKENILVNNRDLIIKKNLTTFYQNDYRQTINKNYSVADKRDWKFTLAMVVPSFSTIPYLEFIILPLICLAGQKSDFSSWFMLSKLYGQEKKMIDRLKDYPYHFSAKKRLNWLINQPERNDIQKDILIAEPIENITLKKVSFAYEEKKPVLKRFDLVFQKGKVNHLQGENGFGKSTIISLIMGLYRPNKGEILINNKYKLNETNLIKWREKIAYAEHENLIENGLSTGQKQWADLDNIFITEKDREIFIFDEADNALDEDNKKLFQQKIDKISKKKLVILISH